jgi:hypothetical protein
MLVALIAMQSVVAIADAHQSHQKGTEHLEFEHEHEHDSVHAIDHASVIENSAPSPNQYDCHHCCHCHGMSFFAVPASANGLDVGSFDDHLVMLPLFYHFHLVSPDIRPPIV